MLESQEPEGETASHGPQNAQARARWSVFWPPHWQAGRRECCQPIKHRRGFHLRICQLHHWPYDPVNANAAIPDDQTGEIIIRCTKGTSGITIALGNGAHNTGSQRRMANVALSSTFINYEVYQDTGRMSVWGVGDGGSLRSGSDLNGTGSVVSVTMYGRIPPAQLGATAGAYNDTLVSTVNF